MTAPQIRLVGAVPRLVLARLQMFFNTNKTFLLPTALPAVQELRQIYADNSPGKLLVVGHADTAGNSAYNDKLSLERAKATIAFLEDDFQTWLDFYDSSVDSKKRWGKVEDHLMIVSMPDFDTKPKDEDAVSWYQRTRKLSVDGKAGTETRTALIQEYMSLDGASLSEIGIQIDATPHGCGENFPLDDSGENLDSAPANDKHDRIDRRVELFFFDSEFGIVPKPPGDNSGPGSTQYPAWRKRVEQTVELRADEVDGPKVTFIEMADAHFRTNSAVVLPEGENPDQTGAHQAFTSVGVIATALRFNDEHPGRTLLVAGHTDTTADPAFNQTLSEERAQVTLALLKGGDDSRENFKNLAQGRHTGADIKQILSWVAGALPGFSCDPGPIDNNPATGAVLRFQNDYNTQRPTIAPSSTDLNPDGSVGPLTWGAFFDCYEFALQQELGEDAPGLQALRDKLVFADPQHEFLGFSEYFPIDELGVDNFRSQTNRRVEILFFEPGEEPDIAQAADDPETSDLYLPGHYERRALTPRGTAKTSNNLDVSTRLDSQPVELHVLAEGDRTVNVFPQSSGVVNGGGIHFLLDPDQLPNPVRFVIKRGEQFEDHGSFFDPVSLRDDLDSGQLGNATATLSAQDQPDDRVAGPGAGAGSAAPVLTSSFGVDAQFVVIIKNAGHRFLQLANVTLQGGTKSPQSKPGAVVFDVPTGTQQVTLNVSIPPQAPGAKKNILTISQTYSLATSNGKFGMFEQGLSHPRVRSLAFVTQKPLVIRVDLDLEFLDVTDHVLALAPTYGTFLSSTQGKDGGCVTVLLEHTAKVPGKTAQDAFTWAIVIPPAAVRKSIDTNLFLFFQNELLVHMLAPSFTVPTDKKVQIQPYVNSDDVNYDRASAFLEVQGKKDPTSGAPQIGPSYLTRTVAGSTTTDKFNETPLPFGWFAQIANSKKPVVVAMPFPKLVSFGPVDTPASAEPLLRSLVVALNADSVLASNSSSLHLRSMAVGGWSSGTDTLVRWCKGTRDAQSSLGRLVQEIYFFDGKESTKQALVAGGDVEQWFKASQSRKLRLIGTANTENESILLAARLGNKEALDIVLDTGGTPNTARVRALPGRADYFYTNALYRDALTLGSPTPALEFRQEGDTIATPAQNVTDETNIFLRSQTFAGGTTKASLTLSFRDLTGRITTEKASIYSEIEAASVLHFDVIPQSPPDGTNSNPVTTAAEFAAVIRSLNINSQVKEEAVRVLKIRHPWAVVGGAARNGSFVGYLQFCLEQSNF